MFDLADECAFPTFFACCLLFMFLRSWVRAAVAPRRIPLGSLAARNQSAE